MRVDFVEMVDSSLRQVMDLCDKLLPGFDLNVQLDERCNVNEDAAVCDMAELIESLRPSPTAQITSENATNLPDEIEFDEDMNFGMTLQEVMMAGYNCEFGAMEPPETESDTTSDTDSEL